MGVCLKGFMELEVLRIAMMTGISAIVLNSYPRPLLNNESNYYLSVEESYGNPIHSFAYERQMGK